MKKLFFTALVAVVAVGGAFAQIYPAGSNQAITDCNASGSTCALIYGPTGYNVPSPNPGGPQQGDPGTQVDLTVLEYTP